MKTETPKKLAEYEDIYYLYYPLAPKVAAQSSALEKTSRFSSRDPEGICMRRELIHIHKPKAPRTWWEVLGQQCGDIDLSMDQQGAIKKEDKVLFTDFEEDKKDSEAQEKARLCWVQATDEEMSILSSKRSWKRTSRAQTQLGKSKVVEEGAGSWTVEAAQRAYEMLEEMFSPQAQPVGIEASKDGNSTQQNNLSKALQKNYLLEAAADEKACAQNLGGLTTHLTIQNEPSEPIPSKAPPIASKVAASLAQSALFEDQTTHIQRNLTTYESIHVGEPGESGSGWTTVCARKKNKGRPRGSGNASPMLLQEKTRIGPNLATGGSKSTGDTPSRTTSAYLAQTSSLPVTAVGRERLSFSDGISNRQGTERVLTYKDKDGQGTCLDDGEEESLNQALPITFSRLQTPSATGLPLAEPMQDESSLKIGGEDKYYRTIDAGNTLPDDSESLLPEKCSESQTVLRPTVESPSSGRQSPCKNVEGLTAEEETSIQSWAEEVENEIEKENTPKISTYPESDPNPTQLSLISASVPQVPFALGRRQDGYASWKQLDEELAQENNSSNARNKAVDTNASSEKMAEESKTWDGYQGSDVTGSLSIYSKNQREPDSDCQTKTPAACEERFVEVVTTLCQPTASPIEASSSRISDFMDEAPQSEYHTAGCSASPSESPQPVGYTRPLEQGEKSPSPADPSPHFSSPTTSLVLVAELQEHQVQEQDSGMAPVDTNQERTKETPLQLELSIGTTEARFESLSSNDTDSEQEKRLEMTMSSDALLHDEMEDESNLDMLIPEIRLETAYRHLLLFEQRARSQLTYLQLLRRRRARLNTKEKVSKEIRDISRTCQSASPIINSAYTDDELTDSEYEATNGSSPGEPYCMRTREPHTLEKQQRLVHLGNITVRLPPNAHQQQSTSQIEVPESTTECKGDTQIETPDRKIKRPAVPIQENWCAKEAIQDKAMSPRELNEQTRPRTVASSANSLVQHSFPSARPRSPRHEQGINSLYQTPFPSETFQSQSTIRPAQPIYLSPHPHPHCSCASRHLQPAIPQILTPPYSHCLLPAHATYQPQISYQPLSSSSGPQTPAGFNPQSRIAQPQFYYPPFYPPGTLYNASWSLPPVAPPFPRNNPCTDPPRDLHTYPRGRSNSRFNHGLYSHPSRQGRNRPDREYKKRPMDIQLAQEMGGLASVFMAELEYGSQCPLPLEEEHEKDDRKKARNVDAIVIPRQVTEVEGESSKKGTLSDKHRDRSWRKLGVDNCSIVLGELLDDGRRAEEYSADNFASEWSQDVIVGIATTPTDNPASIHGFFNFPPTPAALFDAYPPLRHSMVRPSNSSPPSVRVSTPLNDSNIVINPQFRRRSSSEPLPLHSYAYQSCVSTEGISSPTLTELLGTEPSSSSTSSTGSEPPSPSGTQLPTNGNSFYDDDDGGDDDDYVGYYFAGSGNRASNSGGGGDEYIGYYFGGLTQVRGGLSKVLENYSWRVKLRTLSYIDLGKRKYDGYGSPGWEIWMRRGLTDTRKQGIVKWLEEVQLKCEHTETNTLGLGSSGNRKLKGSARIENGEFMKTKLKKEAMYM